MNAEPAPAIPGSVLLWMVQRAVSTRAGEEDTAQLLEGRVSRSDAAALVPASSPDALRPLRDPVVWEARPRPDANFESVLGE